MIGSHKNFSADKLQVFADLKELKDENELLLLQLRQAQEELNLWFTRFHELEAKASAQHAINYSEIIKNPKHEVQKKMSCQAPSAGSFHGSFDKELSEIMSEGIRLTTLVQVLMWTSRTSAQNSLSARLGNLFIQGTSPGGSFVAMLVKLFRIWRESSCSPRNLGGEDFSMVIEEYDSGGFESASKIISTVAAPVVRAKAYTALGRHLIRTGFFGTAATVARYAYEEDPKPYRLKWLAFRLYEMGEIFESDACLSLLPQDTSFSDSELRQRELIYLEAKKLRLQQAKNHRNMLIYNDMINAYGEQVSLTQRSVKHIEKLEQKLNEHEATKQKMLQTHNKQVAIVQAGAQHIEDLKQELLKRDGIEKEMLQANDELVASAHAATQQIEDLKQKLSEHEAAEQEMAQARDEQASLARTSAQQVEELKQKLSEHEAAEQETRVKQEAMNDDVARAEAQLELLKDFLAKEEISKL